MQTFNETKDPNEIKDYKFDWSAQLGVSETIVSQVVSFVDAAGTTSPTQSVASPNSFVWLAGGIDGQKAIFTIRATTSGGRTLEQGFAVNIVDSVRAPTDVENLKADLLIVDETMRKLMRGEMVKEVSRDGRRIVRDNPTFQQLTDHRETLLAAILAAEAGASGRPRRRAITLGWRN